jgi:DnaD/phage-associated family protein
MRAFNGFTDSESFTPVPDVFFHQLLAAIEDPAELKVALFALWQVEHMEGPLRALRRADFDPGQLGLSADQVVSGLERAVKRGILLEAPIEAERFYLLNSPRGRAAAEAIAQGDRRGAEVIMAGAAVERPNIFRLYEENIGPLTPMIAEALRDAEESYPHEWVSEAIALAVERNKRSWSYAEAILKRWKEGGRAEKQDRRDSQEDRQRDVEEKIRKFVED